LTKILLRNSGAPTYGKCEAEFKKKNQLPKAVLQFGQE